MAVQIPVNQQTWGGMWGSPWVVMQAWPLADMWTIALLGPEGGKISGGFGGWEAIDVPRGKPITEWRGRNGPFTLTLDLLYDGWYAGLKRPRLPTSFVGQPNVPWGRGGDWRYGRGEWVEDAIQSLQTLASPGPDMATPPSLRLWGAVHFAAGRYVINGIEWGDSIRDINTGRRMRQQCTVTLIEYNQPTELAKLPRGAAS